MRQVQSVVGGGVGARARRVRRLAQESQREQLAGPGCNIVWCKFVNWSYSVELEATKVALTR